jgi:tRNA A-37 threonylcarbamoyl transferase component Bud32
VTDPGPVPVREGDLLAGKYRVERILGSGGMGVVVAAVHEQLEQRVAIKFVRDEALGNDDAVQRFLREARASVKLKSEHAARVLDVGTLESGAPYMVMEYLEGQDLSALLEEKGPLPVELAAEWIVQACEAVAEAHSLGIVHRDLKPQNLFLAKTVGGSPKVKVLDFGVAKSLISSGAGGLTQTRAMLGSPLYMAPEQMRSARDVDARADVWALGVVLYELLTNHWPFEAESMPELCLKVVSEPPTPISKYRADVPLEMAQLIERCLEKDADKRFANAAEVASALEPMAPAASRFIAERARLAMGTATGTSGIAPVSRAAGQVAFARTEPTPSAWGSGQSGASGGEGKGRALVLWIGLGAVVCISAAVGLLVLRSHSAPALAPAPAVVTTAIGPGPTASAASLVPPATPPAAVSVDPSAASPAATVAPSASPPAPVAPVVGPAPKPNGPPHVVPSAKPKPHDDDIPSLR